MSNLAKFALATAAIVLAATIAATVGGGGIGPAGGAPAATSKSTSTPTPAPSDVAAGPSQSMLPELRMPTYGALAVKEPRDYGWTGTPGSSADMHNVHLGTEIVFGVEGEPGDCFARGEGPEPTPTTLGGFDGLYVEPYGDDPVARFEPRGEVTTGAYALAIGDRTLCVYLSWGASTTSSERAAALDVIANLRAQPFGDDGVRIVFTTLGWDNG